MKKRHARLYLAVISAVLFILHQYFQWIARIPMPFLDNYLDPALMMPILLHLIVWERYVLFRKRPILLTHTHLVGYLILAIIFGEFLFPRLEPKFTADYWDILSYTVGAINYGIAQRMAFQKNNQDYKI